MLRNEHGHYPMVQLFGLVVLCAALSLIAWPIAHFFEMSFGEAFKGLAGGIILLVMMAMIVWRIAECVKNLSRRPGERVRGEGEVRGGGRYMKRKLTGQRGHVMTEKLILVAFLAISLALAIPQYDGLIKAGYGRPAAIVLAFLKGLVFPGLFVLPFAVLFLILYIREVWQRRQNSRATNRPQKKEETDKEVPFVSAPPPRDAGETTVTIPGPILAPLASSETERDSIAVSPPLDPAKSGEERSAIARAIAPPDFYEQPTVVFTPSRKVKQWAWVKLIAGAAGIVYLLVWAYRFQAEGSGALALWMLVLALVPAIAVLGGAVELRTGVPFSEWTSRLKDETKIGKE